MKGQAVRFWTSRVVIMLGILAVAWFRRHAVANRTVFLPGQ
jgi:hypothetical protein